ncbi:hypothetical protein LB504_008749 [Fusarium proliferatum]|nr:hypothetical protein LB504_008749 [Fusarium proliferatum]
MPSKASCPRFQIEIECRGPGLWPRPSTPSIFNYRSLMMECTRERLASVDLAPNQDLAWALGDEPAGWALHCDVDISTLCHASLSSHPDVDAWHHTFTRDIL